MEFDTEDQVLLFLFLGLDYDADILKTETPLDLKIHKSKLKYFFAFPKSLSLCSFFRDLTFGVLMC